MPGCEGVAKGFAKGSAKGLTSKSKESKGFFEHYAYKRNNSLTSLKGYRSSENPFDPFASQVKCFADPFANPFATPSHPFGGTR